MRLTTTKMLPASLKALGKLWLEGIIDWSGYYKSSDVGIPTYPFERKRYNGSA